MKIEDFEKLIKVNLLTGCKMLSAVYEKASTKTDIFS